MPVRDTHGEVVFLLPEGRNITEKKRAEAELARKTEELRVLYDRIKELDELKSQFFENVTHELRTPLTLILGLTKALHQASNLDQRQRQDPGMIERNPGTLLKHFNG